MNKLDLHTLIHNFTTALEHQGQGALTPNERKILALAEELKEAWDLLQPIAEAAKSATRLSSAIPPEKQFLWKPSQSSKDLPGISLANVLDIRKYMEDKDK
jgi:hypothetical protein